MAGDMKNIFATLVLLLMMVIPALAGYDFTQSLNEAHLNGRLKGHLAGKAHVINEASKKFNVDARLLAAVMCYESGWGASRQAKTLYNYSGTRISGQYHNFASHFKSAELKQFNEYPVSERCIYYTAYNLAKRYKNTKSLEAIGAKYCSKSGAAKWAKNVRSIYHSLQLNPAPQAHKSTIKKKHTV